MRGGSREQLCSLITCTCGKRRSTRHICPRGSRCDPHGGHTRCSHWGAGVWLGAPGMPRTGLLGMPLCPVHTLSAQPRSPVRHPSCCSQHLWRPDLGHSRPSPGRRAKAWISRRQRGPSHKSRNPPSHPTLLTSVLPSLVTAWSDLDVQGRVTDSPSLTGCEGSMAFPVPWPPARCFHHHHPRAPPSHGAAQIAFSLVPKPPSLLLTSEHHPGTL